MNKFIKIFLLLEIFALQLLAQPDLPHGHSHNDYLQKRPLFDAVELGFGSIEIDICLDMNKELKVAHIPWFLGGKKNIEELYFEPIAKMIDERSSIFKYSKEFPLNLLIDFKKNPDSTYKYLKIVFVKYAKYITQYKNGEVVYEAPLVINITGNKPWSAMRSDTLLYARMDGPLYVNNPTLDQLGVFYVNKEDLKMMGRAASNYKHLMVFKRSCKDDDEFYRIVRSNIQAYNAHGITARYYEVPNNKKAWEVVMKCGLNWINVDQLQKFSEFYHNCIK